MPFDWKNDEEDISAALDVQRREISAEQIRRFEGYAAEMFGAFGLDLTTPATLDTPRRFVRALFDVTSGYDGDPKVIKVFEKEGHDGPDRHLSQIVEGPIPFYSLCEHHALPFLGSAYVGYIGNEHIIGISKLTRLVHLFARRFTVQERIGEQIADALVAMLDPHGVAIYLEAQHLCTQMRGVHESAPLTRTTFWRGEYSTQPALRSEFFVACGLPR